MFRLTPVVKNLLIVNVIVFIASWFIGGQNFNLNRIIGLYFPESDNFYPFQYFTYMFAHADFTHILFNMLALVFIGPLLENLWGPQKFLTFYILTGLGAALIYTGVQFYQYNNLEQKVENYIESPTPEGFDALVYQEARMVYNDPALSSLIDQYYDNPNNQQYIERSKDYARQIYDLLINIAPMVGASGAIYGLLMALAVLFPNLQLMLLIPPIPIKAKYLALGLAGLSIYLGINRQQGDMVAHFAHLGGMIVAFILIKLWQNKGTRYR